MKRPNWIQNLDTAFEGVLLLDSDSKIIYCNRSAARLLERPQEFIVEQPFCELFITEAGIDPHSSEAQEYLAKANHLTKGPLPLRISSQTLEEGFQLIFIRDLTEYELSQKMIDLLAKVTEEIGSTLEAERTREQVVQVPVPLLADWSALFTFTDDVIHFTKSYHSSEAHGHLLKDYFSNHSNNVVENPDFNRVLMKGEAQIFSLFPEKECKEMPMSQVLCLPLENRNEVVGILCLGTEYPKQFSPGDIAIARELAQKFATALENSHLYQSTVNMENQLLAAKKIAEQANQMKSRFLAVMSHEIRTPLSAILGFSDLLLLENLQNEEQADWAERIRQNGSHLLRLIDDILNISKVESGKIELENEPVSLSQILNQLMISEMPKAVKKKIDFGIRFESPVPESFISDSTRLNQILTNLIGNALKFTSTGGVELALRYEAKGPYLVMVVSDTGPGLSEEQALRLFSPFMQADASHHRQFGGTGLGLAVSRQIARLMGGEVEILRTELGKGTQFQVILPLQLAPETSFFSSLSVESTANSPVPLLKVINPESTLLEGLKVLVVDDSADNCLLVTRFLNKAGAQVISAPNGKVAVEMTFLQKPDVILMDSQMPELNGYEATQMLIQKGFSGPIIALTAGAFPEDREKCIKAGCVALVTKPVQKESLLQTIYQAHSSRAGGGRQFFAPTAKTDSGN